MTTVTDYYYELLERMLVLIRTGRTNYSSGCAAKLVPDEIILVRRFETCDDPTSLLLLRRRAVQGAARFKILVRSKSKEKD